MRRTLEMLGNSDNNMGLTGNKIKADSYFGYTDGIHSVSVKLNAFVGKIKLQGTLSLTPESADWGDIKLIEKSSATTGTEIHTFKGNYVYLRAVLDRTGVGDGNTYDSSYGSISQILLSN
jgi:hypothetical protein